MKRNIQLVNFLTMLEINEQKRQHICMCSDRKLKFKEREREKKNEEV